MSRRSNAGLPASWTLDLLSTVFIWLIAAATILAILLGPRKWPEAVWASIGAAALVLFGLVPLSLAFDAVLQGTDVYLFLTGMMLLAELARREGVFDWLAGIAVAAAKGSRARLFLLVYLVGILVTALLSNDATAVVLTPAVYAAIRAAGVAPLPYLFACAFVANAASFVLPISNPANLVVYGSNLPSLASWLRLFIVPSILSIAATYAVLYFLSHKKFDAPMKAAAGITPLSPAGKRAAWGIAITGATLIAASAFGLDLGLPTCGTAILAVLFATRVRGLSSLVRGVSWSVLPLVAALFVLVDGLNTAGALRFASELLRRVALFSPAAGSLTLSFGIAGLSNILNNLPAALLAGATLRNVAVPEYIRHTLMIGIDLGPNFSVTGSLATILWLVALRREGEHVSAWTFLKIGALVTPPALLLSTLALLASQNHPVR
jgi:arsenical pump membrane protein